MEIWKTIKEFPIYSVSNLGRVRNNQSGCILIGGHDRDGYRQVTLRHKGKQYNRRICRLVAIAFIPNPNNLPHVNHKDESKNNDSAGNLEWCTAKYNNNYGNRTQKTRRKIKCIELNKIFDGVRVAARHFGCGHTTIRMACNNPERTAKGYHWSYL